MSNDTHITTVCKLCDMKDHVDWNCTEYNFPTNCPYNKLHRLAEKKDDELTILKFKQNRSQYYDN